MTPEEEARAWQKHVEHYRAEAKARGISILNDRGLHIIGLKKKAELVAYVQEDKYLNNIPLRRWDLWGEACDSMNPTNKFRSKSEAVCTLKQVARDYAEEVD